MKTLLACATLASVFLCMSCEKGSDTAKIARRLVPMSSEQRRQVLVALPPDKRLDVFLYAATRFEPPLLLANELAAEGPAMLPTLRVRMAEEPDDRRFGKLMLVLVAISASRCSVEDRDDVVRLIQQRISRMTSEDRIVTDQMLNSIIHPAKQLPPCT